jgi:hypothetical protein
VLSFNDWCSLTLTTFLGARTRGVKETGIRSRAGETPVPGEEAQTAPASSSNCHLPFLPFLPSPLRLPLGERGPQQVTFEWLFILQSEHLWA